MRQLLPLPGNPQNPIQDHSNPREMIMGFCGSCQHNAAAPLAQAQLFQIKRGYRARWNAIDFSVEADSDQWTLRVENSINRETLYTAHRGGARAAQSAAVDFASFRLACDSHLKWQAYW
jgi:hypothetical protein